MSAKPAKVGIIGCGNISGIYLENGKVFDMIDIVAVADIDMDRARSQAAKYGVPRACSVAELLADPEIEIVINLTIPAAHAEVAMQVVAAGKSVYTEKPLAVARADGKQLVELAKAGFPIPPDAIIKASSIRSKSEILESMKAATAGPQTPPEVMQLQMRGVEAEVSEKEAKAVKTAAEAEKIQSETVQEKVAFAVQAMQPMQPMQPRNSGAYPG